MRSTILIIVVLFLASEQLVEGQTNSQDKPKSKSKQSANSKLNQRQIDFVLRLHQDMVEPSSQAASAFFYMAYEYDGTKKYMDIKTRIANGLKNEANLPAIVWYAKQAYGQSASIALNGAMPSIDLEECEHLSSISSVRTFRTCKEIRCIFKQIRRTSPQILTTFQFKGEKWLKYSSPARKRL